MEVMQNDMVVAILGEFLYLPNFVSEIEDA